MKSRGWRGDALDRQPFHDFAGASPLYVEPPLCRGRNLGTLVSTGREPRASRPIAPNWVPELGASIRRTQGARPRAKPRRPALAPVAEVQAENANVRVRSFRGVHPVRSPRPRPAATPYSREGDPSMPGVGRPVESPAALTNCPGEPRRRARERRMIGAYPDLGTRTRFLVPCAFPFRARPGTSERIAGETRSSTLWAHAHARQHRTRGSNGVEQRSVEFEGHARVRPSPIAQLELP